ncbi:MAG: low molecular weight phosphotyrosine protein phosphatase [Phycisphaerales bacterium]|nr:low molecular weight phosphotyrosine protein phosphatase [Phycisphaerales bacterium]
MTTQTTVLFVCLGNICRSPLAHGILQHLVDQQSLTAQFHIDSCGTEDWHVGNPPDPRSIQTAALHNIDITNLRARQFDPSTDIDRFQHIIPMDASNKRNLIKLGVPEPKLTLMRAFDPTLQKPQDVPDPYYGGDDGFERVYQMLIRACQGFLDQRDL